MELGEVLRAFELDAVEALLKLRGGGELAPARLARRVLDDEVDALDAVEVGGPLRFPPVRPGDAQRGLSAVPGRVAVALSFDEQHVPRLAGLCQFPQSIGAVPVALAGLHLRLTGQGDARAGKEHVLAILVQVGHAHGRLPEVPVLFQP